MGGAGRVRYMHTRSRVLQVECAPCARSGVVQVECAPCARSGVVQVEFDLHHFLGVQGEVLTCTTPERVLGEHLACTTPE